MLKEPLTTPALSNSSADSIGAASSRFVHCPNYYARIARITRNVAGVISK